MANKNSGLTARYEGPRANADGPVDQRPEVSKSDVPDGSIVEVQQWVSEDKARAAAALEVEKAKGDGARSTLVESLERLVGNED